jgi:hypothetical protein
MLGGETPPNASRWPVGPSEPLDNRIVPPNETGGDRAGLGQGWPPGLPELAPALEIVPRPADAPAAPVMPGPSGQSAPPPNAGTGLPAPQVESPGFPGARTWQSKFDPLLAAGSLPLNPDGWHDVENRYGEWWRLDGLIRGYYVNDQRIRWSGCEATCGVEGILRPVYRADVGGWQITALGEFYINQPFDRNILENDQERRSYAADFQVDTVEISQAFLALRQGNLEAEVGKFNTPFGRYYFPIYTNARFDGPFVRTDVIEWRETGALLRYNPDWLMFEVALTNGGENRDTNSSKAAVSRVGVQQDWGAAGVSVKWQDGDGSEGQKEFDNHVGGDFMVRWDNWILSGEVVYDQYGFVHTGYDANDIFWGRSIYYRDLSSGTNHVPLTGLGYYVDLVYRQGRWAGNIDYGEYYPQRVAYGYFPQQTVVPQQEIINRRGVVKIDYNPATRLDLYLGLMQETDSYIAQENQPRKGTVVFTGAQYQF